MLVEGSKVLVGRLYDEARNMGAFRVREEPKLYHWVREQVQRGLSAAQAVHLRHGSIATWPSLAKPWKVKTSSRTVRVTRRVLRATIADREDLARGNKLLKELLEVADVLGASNAFDPVAIRRLRGERYGSLTPPPFGKMWRSFTGPADALPIDLFRVLVGLLSCAYFSRTLLEAPVFSNPHGLIDRGLVRRTLWYTRLGLFHPGAGPTFFRVLYPLAALGSLLLAAGIWVKPVSAFLYATAVSTYR